MQIYGFFLNSCFLFFYLLQIVVFSDNQPPATHLQSSIQSIMAWKSIVAPEMNGFTYRRRRPTGSTRRLPSGSLYRADYTVFTIRSGVLLSRLIFSHETVYNGISCIE